MRTLIFHIRQNEYFENVILAVLPILEWSLQSFNPDIPVSNFLRNLVKIFVIGILSQVPVPSFTFHLMFRFCAINRRSTYWRFYIYPARAHFSSPVIIHAHIFNCRAFLNYFCAAHILGDPLIIAGAHLHYAFDHFLLPVPVCPIFSTRAYFPSPFILVRSAYQFS